MQKVYKVGDYAPLPTNESDTYMVWGEPNSDGNYPVVFDGNVGEVSPTVSVGSYTQPVMNIPALPDGATGLVSNEVGQLVPEYINTKTGQPTTINSNIRVPFSNRVGDYLLGKKQQLNDYLKDPEKAPQQLTTNWRNLSLGERGQAILGTVGTLMQAYNAHKTNKLAKQQFNHSMNAYNNNLQAQRKMTNSQLEDRQKRRVEEAKANGRTTTSVADYMNKYGV